MLNMDIEIWQFLRNAPEVHPTIINQSEDYEHTRAFRYVI